MVVSISNWSTNFSYLSTTEGFIFSYLVIVSSLLLSNFTFFILIYPILSEENFAFIALIMLLPIISALSNNPVIFPIISVNLAGYKSISFVTLPLKISTFMIKFPVMHKNPGADYDWESYCITVWEI